MTTISVGVILPSATVILTVDEVSQLSFTLPHDEERLNIPCSATTGGGSDLGCEVL